VRWQPIKQLVFRASAGTGFRAPSLPELFTRQVSELAQVGGSDPLRCTVTMLDSDCFPELPILFGGNPALGPERSRQMSFGMIFSPARDALIGLDWWRLNLEHTIAELPDAVVLDGDPRFEGKNIVRGPVDPAFPTLPGPITELIEVNENLGRRTASGVDVGAQLRSPSSPYGRWSVELTGSYLAEWGIAFDGIHLQQVAGTEALPRWQQVLTLGWELKPWAATLVQTWRAGYADENPDANGNARKVSPYNVWDAQVSYAASGAWQIVLGVKNLRNSDPPFTNQRDYFQIGYDPTYADPHGRFWYARATYRWR
jgi:iron complex outermembrane receptor protein